MNRITDLLVALGGSGLALAPLSAGAAETASSPAPLRAFYTRGHPVYHLRAATVERNGGRALVSAAYDGQVLCHAQRGTMLWKTQTGGLSGNLSLLLIDPATMEVLWRQTNLGKFGFNSGKRFFSMTTFDLKGDGKEEILLSHSWGDNGRITAFDGAGKELFSRADARQVPRISYRMNVLTPVALPEDRFILDLFGNLLIQHDLDGTVREVLVSDYSFAWA